MEEEQNQTLKVFRPKQLIRELGIPEWKFYELRNQKVFSEGHKDGKYVVYTWEELQAYRKIVEEMKKPEKLHLEIVPSSEIEASQPEVHDEASGATGKDVRSQDELETSEQREATPAPHAFTLEELARLFTTQSQQTQKQQELRADLSGLSAQVSSVQQALVQLQAQIDTLLLMYCS